MGGQDSQNKDPLAPIISQPALAETGQPTPGPAGLISYNLEIGPIEFLGGLIERYGDVVRYQTRFGTCFVFIHPEHVHTILHRENYRRASLVKMMLGDGLLASDGPRWRSQRRLMQRDFMPPGVAPFVSVMTRETAHTANAWQASAAADEAVDITTAMTRLTLRIVVESLFSDDLSDKASADLCSAITLTINDMGKISWTVFGVPVQLTPDRNASFASGKQVIDSVCYEMIARRRAQAPTDRPRDILTLLIEAETDSGPMDDRQVRDEIVTLLVGGHETTALALAWAWKVIGEHPEIEAKLHKEVDEVLGGRSPELADLPKLPYTQGVFQETMRLYPPVWYMARVANGDDVIHGHAVPRGACVLISTWFTHRHKDFWPEPEKFDPTRFIGSDSKQLHRYAYFPFGGGRHQCLGMYFALMEGTIILADLAQRFRVRPLNSEQIQPAPGITLRQTPGLQASVEPRFPSRAPLPAGSEAI
ncbi:MAG TPA: cytochrome P450 [Tepidisphaeraceae bacterium]|jgi:cytochrome P450|nr:cytochrome P450 [Tepidisphaeraceae bacterium]